MQSTGTGITSTLVLREKFSPVCEVLEQSLREGKAPVPTEGGRMELYTALPCANGREAMLQANGKCDRTGFRGEGQTLQASGHTKNNL